MIQVRINNAVNAALKINNAEWIRTINEVEADLDCVDIEEIMDKHNIKDIVGYPIANICAYKMGC
jgi:hypothetical protein